MIKFKRSLSVKVGYLNCILKIGYYYSAGGLEREIHDLNSGVFPSV